MAKVKVDVDISDDYKLMKAIHNVLSENHITASIREIIRITKTHDVTERHVQKVVLGQCEEFEWHTLPAAVATMPLHTSKTFTNKSIP